MHDEVKVLPHSEEAEKSILGAILLDNPIMDQALEHLQVDALFFASHRMIYKKMQVLYNKALPIDFITLRDELRVAGELERVGGGTFIASLIDGVPKTSSIAGYITIVNEHALKRKLYSFANNIIARIEDGGENSEDLIEAVEREVYEIAERRRHGKGPRHVAAIAARLVDYYDQKARDPDALLGLSTGYDDLDRMTLGLTPGVTLLAARPSQGKSSLAINIACNVAKQGKSVYYLSIESTAEQVVQRILASESRVDSYRMRKGTMLPEEWQRLEAVYQDLSITKFFVDDSTTISPEELTSRCRKYKAQYGLDLVVVDYVQLMARRLLYQRRYKDLRLAVQEVGAGLVALSREDHYGLGVPVLALAQLNREVDQRSEHRPQLSDLAESASLEADSDIIMFLYREEWYKPGKNPGVATVIFGKQRDGCLGEVDMAFIKNYTRFECLARDRNYRPQSPAYNNPESPSYKPYKDDDDE